MFIYISIKLYLRVQFTPLLPTSAKTFGSSSKSSSRVHLDLLSLLIFAPATDCRLEYAGKIWSAKASGRSPIMDAQWLGLTADRTCRTAGVGVGAGVKGEFSGHHVKTQGICSVKRSVEEDWGFWKDILSFSFICCLTGLQDRKRSTEIKRP